MNFISFLHDEGEDRQAVGFVQGRLKGSVPGNKNIFFIKTNTFVCLGTRLMLKCTSCISPMYLIPLTLCSEPLLNINPQWKRISANLRAPTKLEINYYYFLKKTFLPVRGWSAALCGVRVREGPAADQERG